MEHNVSQYDVEPDTAPAVADETPEEVVSETTESSVETAESSVEPVETIDSDMETAESSVEPVETIDPAVEAEADVEADAEADVEADAEADEEDPLEEFRRELWAKPGEWYVVHTYYGMENRVRQNLENRIVSLNMEDYIHEIVVPTEEVAEIKNGQRKMVKRTVLPGYVLVRMDLTDESWAAVRHPPSVTGFVGQAHQPVPLSMAEVENMLAPAAVAARAEAPAGGGAGGGGGAPNQ